MLRFALIGLAAGAAPMSAMAAPTGLALAQTGMLLLAGGVVAGLGWLAGRRQHPPSAPRSPEGPAGYSPAGLLDRQHLLEPLLQTTHQGFWYIDTQGLTVDVNPAMCRLLGRPRDQIIGRRVFDFFTGADLATLKAQIEARRIGQVGGYEVGIERPDGSRIHCHNNATPVRDRHGAVIGSIGLWTDITAHRQTETALRTYELVANSMTDMVSVVGDDQIYRMVNDAWCRSTGHRREDVIGKRATDVLPAGSSPARREALLACIEQQQVRTVRDTIALPGLAGRTVETTYYPYVGDDAETRCVVMVTRDVTEQEQHTQQLAVTLESVAQGIVCLDAGGHTLFYNRQALELLGLPEHLLQPPYTFDDVVKVQIARGELDEKARYLDAQGQWQTIAGGRMHAPEVYVRRNHAGRLLEVRTRRLADGSLVRTYADVTPHYDAQQALRQSEAELRAVLDAFPGYIAAVDTDGIYRYVNERFTGLLGLTPQAMIGRSIREVLGDARAAEVEREVARAHAGERVRTERHYVSHDDQRTVHLEITHVAGPVKPDGQRNIYAFANDITARKRAEAELVAARDEAQRASSAKSQFVSHMSHELRTPLNAILGFGQLLESDSHDPLSPAHRRHVVEILRGGRHLLGLINDLLDLGSIEAGQMLLSTEAVPVEPLLDECLSLVRPLAEAHAITLELHGMPREALRVAADATRLKQVLLNLLGNAIKYNRRPGTVGVRVHRDGEQLQIGVTDSGMGLSLEQQDRLFRPFERLGAGRQGIEGTGIGLALSRRLVEAMRGTIGVDSTVGVGSTFWVRLPLLHAPALPAAARSAHAPLDDAASSSTTGATPRTVLYIEDNPVNMMVMQATLARVPGLRFIGASTSAAGLELALRQQPDLILLDIGLPDLDGHEVLERLRRDPRTVAIPAVAVTANAMQAEIDAAMAAGFADYLTKPFEIEHLVDVVMRLTSAA